MSDAAVEAEAKRLLDRCVVVLVKTTHSGNIGAVARACKTMGINRLRLAAPVAAIDDEAVRRASGADDVLSRAEIFPDLESAIADCHMVVGASARSRSMVWPVAAPRDIAEDVFHRQDLNDGSAQAEVGGFGDAATTALVFGQEASGLTNEELHLCHRHVCIPANPGYSSLNLAMAVQVMTYEMRIAALNACVIGDCGSEQPVVHGAVLDPESPGWDELPATHAEFEGMLTHLERALTWLGYHNPDNPRMLMPRIRRLFARAKMDRMEVNILRGICKAILNVDPPSTGGKQAAKVPPSS